MEVLKLVFVLVIFLATIVTRWSASLTLQDSHEHNTRHQLSINQETWKALLSKICFTWYNFDVFHIFLLCFQLLQPSNLLIDHLNYVK